MKNFGLYLTLALLTVSGLAAMDGVKEKLTDAQISNGLVQLRRLNADDLDARFDDETVERIIVALANADRQAAAVARKAKLAAALAGAPRPFGRQVPGELDAAPLSATEEVAELKARLELAELREKAKKVDEQEDKLQKARSVVLVTALPDAPKEIVKTADMLKAEKDDEDKKKSDKAKAFQEKLNAEAVARGKREETFATDQAIEDTKVADLCERLTVELKLQKEAIKGIATVVTAEQKLKNFDAHVKKTLKTADEDHAKTIEALKEELRQAREKANENIARAEAKIAKEEERHNQVKNAKRAHYNEIAAELAQN